ncbi:mannan endo-1,4-beta-mannosidase 6-like [Phalaenopsis equestris]|uniref:mannan endo-1,4-beta-mannosidase 6-like n=1 Tax=Phalaenopsis equestris TaxID=78828 RepID=UPI0009E3772A|nr:mannan endo-1,4-beta-mannosidase 6-like [Phalaenopsis equestris]XP_020588078.1 mannan endo-1,4-beta-mannosidase 6-like [Phalaenopsis equestris]XP_020588079.1 mannan endo-1,4-beta-mannosidase 6-like [Phalaenopsis equestris]
MERRAYTAFGFILLATFFYFNWISSGSGGGFRIRIPIPWLQPKMDFIGRNGTHFIDVEDGTPVYVNGWNSYWLISSKLEEISEMFRRGRAMGMTVCRTWAFSDGGANALQISPGRFNERYLQALDFVIYDARRNNIRLILCLVNNLNAFGGKAQYVRWAQAAGANVTSTDSFFSDPIIKHYYKDYVKKILSRKNSFSGVRYKDEPAIFAWELMNEPRCVLNSSAPLLQEWIAEMASYIKSLDQKHLVTVGLEGFYGQGRTERLGANPGEWASSLGSDFIQNSADENIDFASVHAYPDSWIPKASFEEKVKYLSSWVDYHVNDSEHVLKKPVLFAEVGSRLGGKKNGSYDRDIILKIVYDKLYESAKKGEAGTGALIWQLMIEGKQPYKDEFSLVASQHPSTYKLILQQSCRLRKLFRRKGETRSILWPCTDA